MHMGQRALDVPLRWVLRLNLVCRFEDLTTNAAWPCTTSARRKPPPLVLSDQRNLTSPNMTPMGDLVLDAARRCISATGFRDCSPSLFRR